MDNKLVTKIIKSNKLSKYKKIPTIYKYKKVSNYTKLTPLTYTVLLKNTKIVTNINKKKESHINLKRGDYVLCGVKNEKYGLALEKILETIYHVKRGKIEDDDIKRAKRSFCNINEMTMNNPSDLFDYYTSNIIRGLEISSPLDSCSKIILPGVGSFQTAMKSLSQSKLDKKI